MALIIDFSSKNIGSQKVFKKYRVPKSVPGSCKTAWTLYLKSIPAISDTKEKLKTLKLAYFTHRQVGAFEAVYRVIPGMRLKESYNATIFVPKGFPENQSVICKKSF